MNLKRWSVKATVLVLVLLCLGLMACTGRQSVSHTAFVGKWKSSKLETPLYLYDNGDWEIKQDDGSVLQYGVWAYRDPSITWSFKSGGRISHDVNRVVSVSAQEFRLQEGAETTVFRRLD